MGIDFSQFMDEFEKHLTQFQQCFVGGGVFRIFGGAIGSIGAGKDFLVSE